MKAVVMCLAAVLLDGCATVVRVEAESCSPLVDGAVPVKTVQVMNTNWRLLSFMPLASGDPENPNRCTCLWFRNTVTLQSQLDMLAEEIRRAGATRAVRVTSDVNKERALFFLFLREKMRTSAMLVRDPVKVEP